jgi:hypothetical protein
MCPSTSSLALDAAMLHRSDYHAHNEPKSKARTGSKAPRSIGDVFAARAASSNRASIFDDPEALVDVEMPPRDTDPPFALEEILAALRPAARNAETPTGAESTSDDNKEDDEDHYAEKYRDAGTENEQQLNNNAMGPRLNGDNHCLVCNGLLRRRLAIVSLGLLRAL